MDFIMLGRMVYVQKRKEVIIKRRFLQYLFLLFLEKDRIRPIDDIIIGNNYSSRNK